MSKPTGFTNQALAQKYLLPKTRIGGFDKDKLRINLNNKKKPFNRSNTPPSNQSKSAAAMLAQRQSMIDSEQGLGMAYGNQGTPLRVKNKPKLLHEDLPGIAENDYLGDDQGYNPDVDP